MMVLGNENIFDGLFFISYLGFFPPRLDGNDDDAEPPDASVGGATDDVTQFTRGQQRGTSPRNLHVRTYSSGM